jgi:hypothetical protein
MKKTFEDDFEFRNKVKLRAGHKQMIIEFEPEIWATISFSGRIVDAKSAEVKIRQFFAKLNIYAKKPVVRGRIRILAYLDRHRVKGQGKQVHVHMFIKRLPAEYCGLLEAIAKDHVGDTKAEPFDPEDKAKWYASNKVGTKYFIDSEPWTIFIKPYNPDYKPPIKSKVSSSKNLSQKNFFTRN